ncbi:MAG: adenylate/guanylate cyclase domain-containing protein [Gammaproteobacteria bacterium]|nr:adenylate/guanylate cyclase domain-containing protein [Gammaproteobacteria bacterium]MDX2460977.1 adenylate/guanylate cyclase domain-containing protein [Gammaproteobacteria bacterium]
MAETRGAGKLAVILHADIADSTALVQQDEHLAHQCIQDTFHRFSDTISQYHGQVRELRGDALLAEFDRASGAVTAALAFQADQAEHNAQFHGSIQPIVRVGISMGEVVVADNTMTGSGVVLAQRVEQLAEPGAVCITGAIHEALPQRMPFDQRDLGEREVKGFDEPVRVYIVRLKEDADLPMPIEFESAPLEAMTQPLPPKPSIAVLPFDDLSAGDDQDYLTDAISEGIITELSRFSELFVIARSSSFQYRDKATDIRVIAAELGVHYVVEGSQQKGRDRLRVTVQLIDARAGNHIWAERYDRSLDDLFIVQDEIVRAVASAVGAKIVFRQPPKGGRERLSALHHHLKAREYIRQFTKESVEQAQLENLAAIEADPTSPFGYIGLTFVHLKGYQWGWTDLEPEEALSRAREMAETALELDPNNYDAHYARAYVHVHAGEEDLAIERFRKSIELNPSATNVMAAISSPLRYAGRIDEAIEYLHRAIRLDPHHHDWVKWELAEAQWHARDCEAALSTMLSMASIPNPARLTLAAIYVCLDRKEDAEATITRFLELEPGYSMAKEKGKMQGQHKNPDVLERWIDALRTAGLPE